MSAVNPYAPPAADLEARELGAVPALWNPNAAEAWSLLFTPIFGSILLLQIAFGCWFGFLFVFFLIFDATLGS